MQRQSPKYMAAADWEQLPTDLLGSIIERLTVPDYVRFSAVCTSWASTASRRDGLYRPLAPQMPWLLLSGDDVEEGGGESRTLVSLPDHRRHRARFPEMRGKCCVGSQDGWLAVVDELSEVSLLNPLTGAQIHLPSAAKADGSVSIGSITILSPHRAVTFRKIVLSSGPASGSYRAMAIFGLCHHAVFATSGEEKWTQLTAGRPTGPPTVSDVISRDGEFLAVSSTGELWSLDHTRRSPRLTVVARGNLDWLYRGYANYLAESSGDLLQVWIGPPRAVEVMRLDPDRAAWVPLRSLGGSSLFLGLSNSISLSAREVSGLKGNCIYVARVFRKEFWAWELIKGRDVGVFNLEDGSFHHYRPPQDPGSSDCKVPSIWFSPSLL